MLALLGKIATKAIALEVKTNDFITHIIKDGKYVAGKFMFKKGTGEKFAWLNYLYDYLSPVLWAIMAIVCAAGAIYAIYLGVNLARAEDQNKRDEAKKHLITTLIAVGVTIALTIFFVELVPYIISAFNSDIQIYNKDNIAPINS